MKIVNGDSNPILRFQGVSMIYPKTDKYSLSNVDLEIYPSQIMGLLGPNGSGKTTTVKIASGLLLQTSGKVTICGQDNQNISRKDLSVGLVLGGDRGFYGRATVQENMLFFADLAGLGATQRSKRINESLELVDLQDKVSQKVNTLSRGMKQRMHIARAILARPSLLMLDEPTSGLDPEIAIQIRQLVKQIAIGGTGILLTTHYLSEAEELADQVTLIKNGSVIANGSLKEILSESPIRAVTTFSSSSNSNHVEQLFENAGFPKPPIVTEVSNSTYRHTIQWISKPSEKLLNFISQEKVISGNGDQITRTPSLEEVYLAHFSLENMYL